METKTPETMGIMTPVYYGPPPVDIPPQTVPYPFIPEKITPWYPSESTATNNIFIGGTNFGSLDEPEIEIGKSLSDNSFVLLIIKTALNRTIYKFKTENLEKMVGNLQKYLKKMKSKR